MVLSATIAFLNAARQAPAAWTAAYMGTTGARTAPFMLLPRQPPLYWSYDLTRSSRAHSTELIETCPNNPPPPHFSCGGTESFDKRIGRFYAPSTIGCSENQVSVPDSSNQYFHLPRHSLRMFLCDGQFEWTGTGNAAYPMGTCPPDGSAGHRRNIFSPDAKHVGVGVWGKSGVLINAAPWNQVQDFAFNTDVFYPAVRLYSGSHVFVGDGTGDNMQTMQFIASYFDPAGGATPPQKIQVWLMGNTIPLTCDTGNGWGVSPNDCVYRSAVIPTTPNCRLYFFDVVDSAGVARRYPASGAYWTYGEGACRSDWIPASSADPIIAANGQGATPPPATQTTVAGATTNTQPATSATGGPPPTTQPGFLNTGCVLRIQYQADFQLYVSNGQFNAPALQSLQASTATLLGLQSNRLLAKQVSFGSTIVDWFIFDLTTAGSAAAAADSFLARLATNTDVPIGQHQPPIMTGSMVSRATTSNAAVAPVGGSGGGGPSIAMIAGIAAGVGVLLIVAIVVVIIVLVKKRRESSGYSSSNLVTTPLLQSRYEPIASQHYDYGGGSSGAGAGGGGGGALHSQGRYEPVYSQHYGAGMGATVESPRAAMYAGSQGMAAAGGGDGLRRRSAAAERCRVLYDFSSDLPDTLAVRAGEVVTVIDKSNPEWYDVQNEEGVLGFVPAGYLAASSTVQPPSPGPVRREVSPAPAQNVSNFVAPAKPVPKPPGAAVTKELPKPPAKHTPKPPPVVQPVYAEYFAEEEFPAEEEAADLQYEETPVAVDFDVDEDATVQEETIAAMTPPPAVVATAARPYVPAVKVKVKRKLPPNPKQPGGSYQQQQQRAPMKQQPVKVVKVKVKKVVANPPAAGQPMMTSPRLAAPIPGTPLRALYAHTPLTEREVALRPGDQLIVPAGMESLGGDEWVYVFNRNSSQKGYVPRSFIG